VIMSAEEGPALRWPSFLVSLQFFGAAWRGRTVDAERMDPLKQWELLPSRVKPSVGGVARRNFQ